MGVSEIRRLKQLEDENARLKRLVADLTLDKTMPQVALRKKHSGEARPSSRGCPALAGGLGVVEAKGMPGDGLRAGITQVPVTTRSGGGTADAVEEAG